MNKKEILALDLFATSASGKCHSYERYLEELRGHVANTAYSKAYSLAFEAIFNDKQLYQLWKDGVEVHQDALRRCFEQIEQGVYIPEEYIRTEVAARNSGIEKLREVLAPILEQRLADRISKMGHKSSVDRIETTKKLQEKGISLLEKYGLTPLMINMMRKKYHADTQKAYIELCNKQQDILTAKNVLNALFTTTLKTLHISKCVIMLLLILNKTSKLLLKTKQCMLQMFYAQLTVLNKFKIN